MRAVSRWFAGALLSLVVTTVILAQAPALDLKMGLWEVTMNTDIAGQMPAIDASKMTPEQQARIEAMRQALVGAKVTKTCITKEKLNRSNFLTNDQPEDCKKTIATNTRTTLDMSLVCTGAQSGTRQIHLEAPSSTNINGTVKSSTTQQGRNMTVNFAMAGKWLGADCGDIK
jgi:uncharacterized protein DUF3617